MSDVNLTSNFLANARGFTFSDGGGATWSFDPATNKLSVALSVAAGSVADDAITNAKLANMAQATIKGRAAGAGTGDPSDLTASQVKTILSLAAIDISDFNEAAEDAVLGASADSSTIDITYNDAGNSWSASIVLDSVGNTFLANMAQATIKGRAAGAGTGDPTDLTASQVKTILSYAVTDMSDVTTGTFTGTLTGCTTSPTQTLRYVKIGSLVIMSIDAALSATSNTTLCTITGLPAALIPARNQLCLGRVIESGVTGVGGIRVDTGTGDLTLCVSYATFAPAGFTAAGTKGLNVCTWSFHLN